MAIDVNSQARPRRCGWARPRCVCVWKQEAGRWGKEVEGEFLLELPSKFISFIVPIFPKSMAKKPGFYVKALFNTT